MVRTQMGASAMQKKQRRSSGASPPGNKAVSLAVAAQIETLKARTDTLEAAFRAREQNFRKEVRGLTAELRRAERRHSALKAETSHWTRNMLAVIRSIIWRGPSGDIGVEDYAGHLGGRIESLARAYSMAMRSLDGGVALEEIVREELAAQLGRVDARISVSGPPVRIAARGVDLLTLAIHELTMNAIQHGALGSADGTLRVAWQVVKEDAGAIELSWAENGGKVSEKDFRTGGFGLELLGRTLRYHFDARTVRKAGRGALHWQILLPSDRVVFQKGGRN